MEVRVLSKLDRVGAGLSFACAVHCILLPVVFTVLPLLGLGFLQESLFEAVMVILAVTLALLSLCWGTRLHGRKRTLLFVAAAGIFFVSAHSVEGQAHWPLMALGGVSLAAGHLLNRHYCHKCHSCSEH